MTASSHRPITAFALIALSLFPLQRAASQDPVKLWEESIKIPTYEVAPPDRNPRFYAGRVYQGARASFYPYPVYDRLMDRKTEKSYRALFLENRFVRLCILPEVGGRIFEALDKTNGYDFFYRQHVIKPALIGMLGAWISGGVEWNVPHHHRATSLLPVDCATEEGTDGSKTIWVGEIELRHGLKWIVGVTLRPDRSSVEMAVKIFNRTPLPHSFLFWINPAVHANPDYQVIFPPLTEWAVQHGKPEFASWPSARQVYGGVDYTGGVDISWWKNHPAPVSFFAWNSEEDFFGGYDHGKRAGVIHVANHHVVPGKKFFEWGNGPEGEMWTKVLTDADGPYLELMAGAYSDNQPDYSWCQPGEVKVFQHLWYPIRDLGVVKNADAEGAVNLEVRDRRARIAFNTTAEWNGAVARLDAGDQNIFIKESVNIGPGKPFSAEVPLPENTAEESLRAYLLDSAGRELIAYQTVKRKGSPMPAPVKRPAPPKDIPTSEELYLTGLRVEQLHSPAAEAAPYYEEALRRDPGDIRAHTALGILLTKHGRFQEAEAHLRKAMERATENYIRPKDGEPFYYLGVALMGQEKREQAADFFWRAVWSQAWQGPGYHALAQIEADRLHFSEALDLLDRCLSSGVLNTRARDLKASLCRRLGRLEEAERIAENTLTIDPLDAWAMNEIYLVRAMEGPKEKGDEALRDFEKLVRGEAEAYIELAVGYGNAGLWDEAIDALERAVRSAKDKKGIDPMVYYHLGYACWKKKREDEQMYYRLAAKMPPDLCFPHRFESARVLRHAMDVMPTDPRAPYYLGNLLYDHQSEAAIEAWEKSAQLDGSFPTVHRNLALAYAQSRGDLPKAIESYDRAITLTPEDPRLLYERDVLCEAAGADPRKRLEVLESRREVVARRDDAITREIVLLIQLGMPEKALEILRSRRFHNWEGRSEIHGIYVDACLERGRARLRAGKPREALEDFEAALEYPENLEVGRPYRERGAAQVQYAIGTAREALGEPEKAREWYEKAAARSDGGPSEAQYFQALALRKLGKEEEARKIFQGLLDRGKRDLEGASGVDYFAKFGEKEAERLRKARAHYFMGLGHLGLGNRPEAEAELRKVLELDPVHLGARRELGSS